MIENTFLHMVDTCIKLPYCKNKQFWKSFVVKLSRLVSPKLAIAKVIKPEYFKAR